MPKKENKLEIATFAGGCFWCTETIFNQLKGVKSVISGYTGGDSDNPDYWSIHKGKSTHAEAIQITFDSEVISYKDLLFIFFRTHNPTTLNRQGVDIGPEYRSVIFYHSEEQKNIASEIIDETDREKIYNSPIVTEVEKFTKFFPAENYHQNYYKQNKGNFYCKAVIDPKLYKLKKDFKKFLKDE